MSGARRALLTVALENMAVNGVESLALYSGMIIFFFKFVSLDVTGDAHVDQMIEGVISKDYQRGNNFS